MTDQLYNRDPCSDCDAAVAIEAASIHKPFGEGYVT